MPFSIQTNVNSLVAQENLRVNSNFQSQTIQRLTSGYRINSSGDDAAGLAIANKFRSDTAELAQGVRNANDGVSTLQIIDGGMNNVSKMLDRLRTLATQSASQTFTGDRGVVNSEFQSLLTEIDRQAQSIGLDTGGQFAKSLSVFIGGGVSSGTGGISTDNGTVTLDLSKSMVDSRSLGLKGMQAVTGTANVGSTSETSVQSIVNNATNKASESTPGYSVFYFSGPGFADGKKIGVSVNLGSVTDTASLASAINAGIANAANGTTASATAFKGAGIVASVHTDASGGEQLAFTSSVAAFQVQAGDQMSNALMGNFSTGSTGESLLTSVTGKATDSAGNNLANAVQIKITGAALASPKEFDLAAGSTIAATITTLKAALAADADIQAAGITVDQNAAGQLVFSNSRNEQFSVSAAGDLSNQLGLGAYVSSGTETEYTTVTSSADYARTNTTASGQATFEFSVNGGAAIGLTGISLAGGDATQGTMAITGFATETIIGTTNDAFSFSVDGNQVDVVLTTAGTAATVTSNNAVASYTLDAGNNDSFMLSYGSSGPVEVTLTATQANTGALVTHLQNRVDAALGANKVVVSADVSNHIVFSSYDKGSTAMVSIGASPGNTGLAAIGYTAGVADTGGAGATADQIAAQIQSQADTQLAGTGASITASAASGTLTITNGNAGASHTMVTVASEATGDTMWADDAGGNSKVTVTAGLNRTGQSIADAINLQIASNATLSEAGLSASFSANRITVASSNATQFRLNAGSAPAKGTVTSTVDVTGGVDFTTSPKTLKISVDGEDATTVTLNQNYASATVLAAAIDSQLTNADAAVVSVNGKEFLQITSRSGAAYSVAVEGDGTANAQLGFTDSATKSGAAEVTVGFGVSNSSNASSLALSAADSALSVVNASGTSQTGVLSFAALTSGSTQALTFAANNANGAMQSVTVTLAATGAGTPALSNDGSGSNIDQAVTYINQQLQKTDNATLQKIVAVKQTVDGQEEINFISSVSAFQVGIGSTTAHQGLNDGKAKTAASELDGSGSTVTVSTRAEALTAVTAIANAVSKLGTAQAAVGKGQNQLNYAVNLAQSQISNFSAAESRIRDADVASEAANLTKAQVLQQASIAAMAQANSAPQAVLSLLRG